ncbi:hypothetical protein GCM10009544_17610 [Streptomyces stramineus]|uniref:Uncharacterized protein n=1 Tax=Streptomyces stramineus TaxID=173861 RepID=A0ABN0ZQ68_9ACTN
MGWLNSFVLSQRQQCGDVRRDARVLLDSGRGCPRCKERQVAHCGQCRVVAAVQATVPPALRISCWSTLSVVT